MKDQTPPLFPSRVFGSAEISACGRYRYELARSWDRTRPIVSFVMLNPSTADAAEDDPTIRRCIGFANRWGYGELRVYNLFAWRATRPEDLLGVDDPFGVDNTKWLKFALRGSMVVAAWGAFDCGGKSAAIGRLFAGWATDGKWDLWCLGTTASGAPRHPLYVRGDAQLQVWKVEEER